MGICLWLEEDEGLKQKGGASLYKPAAIGFEMKNRTTFLMIVRGIIMTGSPDLTKPPHGRQPLNMRIEYKSPRQSMFSPLVRVMVVLLPALLAVFLFLPHLLLLMVVVSRVVVVRQSLGGAGPARSRRLPPSATAATAAPGLALLLLHGCPFISSRCRCTRVFGGLRSVNGPRCGERLEVLGDADDLGKIVVQHGDIVHLYQQRMEGNIIMTKRLGVSWFSRSVLFILK